MKDFAERARELGGPTRGGVMPLRVIGAGVGRTGTHSLKSAINHLGMGPCHHMEDVRFNMPTQVPLWTAAANGRPDWETIFKDYESAVDWPTAAFVRELSAAYPSAKFILTVRSPESWAQSFSETIYELIGGEHKVPPEMEAWSKMVVRVIGKTGFSAGFDTADLMKAFIAHNDAVKGTIPAHRLLVYQIKDGWAPLCDFLDVPVPADPFPQSNDRVEFWNRVTGRK